MNKIKKIVVKMICFFESFFEKRYAINPKKTTAIVACPLGNAKVVSGIKEFNGLVL